jgi:hypothetical protein
MVTANHEARDALERALADGDGILRLDPAPWIAEQRAQAGDHDRDELLITHDAAVRPHVIENTGSPDLVLNTFFGSDINPDVPALPSWRAPGPPIVS